ncbi:uncharacterized protein LOC132737376 [Ruditapes philippinarum]|uniref:uncharacterized protein LOC132737376 n=1 Tax=Ruditapes philippinarum TaxID=129788 RepID=UPI00295C131D|nr:uncharacterized protein LOC132737376 [Ruditapes philippinarum]
MSSLYILTLLVMSFLILSNGKDLRSRPVTTHESRNPHHSSVKIANIHHARTPNKRIWTPKFHPNILNSRIVHRTTAVPFETQRILAEKWFKQDAGARMSFGEKISKG